MRCCNSFTGLRFITSIDLSSALLHIALERESRKSAAFHDEAQIYQFICTPHGFRKSLADFERDLQATIGLETCGYTLAYVDDIV
jgi:hypothetical protein